MRDDSSLAGLRLLILLRCVALVAQAVAIVGAVTLLGLALPLPRLLAILAGLGLVNLLTALRLRTARQVGALEFLAQLTIDMAALYLLLRLTGGAANPFASLFILQVVIAAILLPPRLTWGVAVLAVGFYTALLFSSEGGLPFLHRMPGMGFGLHVEGMWLGFVLLAAIVAGFVVRLNAIIRAQESLLAEAEKTAAVGMLAAGAAHELGSPLMTLTLLAEALPRPMEEAERLRHAERIGEQLARCRAILGRITAEGGVPRAEESAALPLDMFVNGIAEAWRGEHPGLSLDVAFEGENPPTIVAERSLSRVMLDLLDNAADASMQPILLSTGWNAREVRLVVTDNGPGLAPEIHRRLGEPGLTTKSAGLGMAIFLARRTLARLGGELSFETARGGGTRAVVALPLRRIAA